MDLYHTVHEPDVASFEIPSDTHRLATVSAVDALDGPADAAVVGLATGLARLDGVLAGPALDLAVPQPREAAGGSPDARLQAHAGADGAQAPRGGLSLGQLTEVWGPPGVGKTTFGIQVAAHALVDKHAVMWVDCSAPLWGPRFTEVLNAVYRSKLPPAAATPTVTATATATATASASASASNHSPATFGRPPAESGSGRQDSADDREKSGEDVDQKQDDDSEEEEQPPEFDVTSAELAYYSCDSLAQVIALIQRPNPLLFPKDTTLLVLDGLATLINNTIPRPNGNAQKQFRGPKAHSPSAKRLQVLQSIVGSLQKLAATRNCAVLLLSQCATKMDAGRGASLAPAINGTVWDQAMATRLVLFKDWFWKAEQENASKRRGHDSFGEVVFVGVQKVQGKVMLDAMEHMIGFHIQSYGLVAEDKIHRDCADLGSASKRKLEQTDFEVGDSDSDEHWDNDFIDQIPRPSQWQGSEDLILDQRRHEDDDEEEEEEEEDQAAGENSNDNASGRAWAGDLLSAGISTNARIHGYAEYEEDNGGESGHHGAGAGGAGGTGSSKRRNWGDTIPATAEQDEEEEDWDRDYSETRQSQSQRLILSLDYSRKPANNSGGGSSSAGTTSSRSKSRAVKSKGDMARRPKRML